MTERKDFLRQALVSHMDCSSSSESENNCILNYSTSSSSSSSSEDEYVSANNHAVVPNFLNTVESYSEIDFKRHFRLQRSTVSSLIDMYLTAEAAPNHTHGGRMKMGHIKEMYIFLWYLANTITYRQLANLFGVSKLSAWTAVIRVSSWFESISHQYIQWPGRDQILSETAAFERMKGIPGIVGAIDGTHFKIKAPVDNAIAYFNRKKYHSLAMQAVVDSKKRFIDIRCGEPGSLHDSRILRRSSLFTNATENVNRMFPNKTFIIGDSAYPLKDWLITPFKDNGSLTANELNFNAIHSSTRMVVENAFGLLKCRFRRLLYFNESTDLKICTNIIIAGCVLHNICMNENDDCESYDSEADSEYLEEEVNEGVGEVQQNRREQLLDELINNRIL